MNFGDSILTSLFVMGMVFLLLASVYLIVLLVSVGIKIGSGFVRKRNDGAPSEMTPLAVSEQTGTGSMKLIDTDEETAALIMAIVSDESGIPLTELDFKRIKLIKTNKE